jgi:hypothetical protein
MNVIGKIIVALPEMSGQSKAGNQWKKREYVLETLENYPRKIHFDFFGEKADQFPLQVGQVINLSFDIESREYNGRWYTSIRGWKAEDAPAGMPAGMPGAAPMADPYGAPMAPPAGYGAPSNLGAFPPPPATVDPGASDDLPF